MYKVPDCSSAGDSQVMMRKKGNNAKKCSKIKYSIDYFVEK